MERNKVTRQDLLRLARARVFTTQDLAEIFDVSPSHAAKLAFDLRKKGLLTPVKRGVYAAVPLEADPKGFRPDPFLATQKALGEGYIFSHHSALALLGGERAVRRTVDVSAPGVRSRRRNLGNFVVHIHSIPKEVFVKVTTRVRRGGVTLLVTSPEQTLVDLASLPNPMQDYQEDLEAVRTLLPKSNPGKFLEVVRATRSPATLARVGHLLCTGGKPALQLAEVLRLIRNSLVHAGPIYFATRPNEPTNRFDRDFKLVYPGGR
jgi:predicted transcriptional regulator of viral defense system